MQQEMDSRNQAGQTSSVSNSCSSEVPASRDVTTRHLYELQCSEVVEEKRKKETSDRLPASAPKREEQSDIISTVVRFLETHTAYDALPASGKVSVFNSNMPICLAFECLRSQGSSYRFFLHSQKLRKQSFGITKRIATLAYSTAVI